MEIINFIEKELEKLGYVNGWSIQKNIKHGQSETFTVLDVESNPLCIAKCFDFLDSERIKHSLGKSFIEQCNSIDELLDNIDSVGESLFNIEETIEVIELQKRCFDRYIDVCSRENLKCFPKIIHYISEVKIETSFYGILIEEFVNGSTLDKVFKENNVISIQDVNAFLEQLGNVILEMNKNGIVHRDISPDNIMFLDNNYVLIDPGMVKIEDNNPTLKSTYLLGKKFYASPEQYSGYAKNVTFSSDLYAVGIIALEYILGKNPLKNIIQTNNPSGRIPHADLLNDYERSIEDSFYNRLEENETSAILFKIIQKMIQVDKNLRYDKIESFILDLQNLRERIEA